MLHSTAVRWSLCTRDPAHQIAMLGKWQESRKGVVGKLEVVTRLLAILPTYASASNVRVT